MEGFDPDLIYNGHVDTQYNMLPTYEVTNPLIKIQADSKVVLKTGRAQFVARETKIKLWTGGPHPNVPCLVEGDHPLMLQMINTKAPQIVSDD